MEDQFGGRTDDDLFYDDFEPVDGQVIVMPDIPLELAAAFGKKSQGLLATPKSEQAPISDSGPITVKCEASQKPVASTTPAPIASPEPPRRGLANSRFAPKSSESDDAALKTTAPADTPKPRKNNRSKSSKTQKPKDAVHTATSESSKPTALNTETAPKNLPEPATELLTESKTPDLKNTKSKAIDTSTKSRQEREKSKQTGKNAQGDQSTSRKEKGQSSTPRKPVDNSRIQSGANPRTKMSEEEVTAKMEQMRLKNAETVKKFEAAEKDQTRHAIAVAHDEEELQRRAKAEAEERKKLENERQKNREKKLKSFKDNDAPWDVPKSPREPIMSPRNGRGGPRTSGSQRGGLRGSIHSRHDETAPKAAGADSNRPAKHEGDLFPRLAGASNAPTLKAMPGPSFAKAAQAGAASLPASTPTVPKGTSDEVGPRGANDSVSSSDKAAVVEPQAWKPKPLTPLPALDVGNWGDEMEEYEAQQAQKNVDK
ncbi:hypothetical protein BROUX41_005759 [Berkeleyomyces rouxiae]|uniref:uncharacterized protein n=1 Tax=Berkeleyomyces rouxiae TaxID=2035830 RepID=UPI003B7BEE4B